MLCSLGNIVLVLCCFSEITYKLSSCILQVLFAVLVDEQRVNQMEGCCSHLNDL